MAVGHRGRRGAWHPRGGHHGLGLAGVLCCRHRANAAGCLVPGGPARRRESRPRAHRCAIPTHKPCRPGVFIGLRTEASEANQKRVDDTRSAAHVEPLVGTIGPVTIAGFVRDVRASAGRRPVRCARCRSCRPRCPDPALRLASLIGRRTPARASCRLRGGAKAFKGL
jgi:NAD-dependent dihydropyrimidine dehydrogenase PreA subunit